MKKMLLTKISMVMLTLFLSTNSAFASISFVDKPPFECDDSYKTGCFFTTQVPRHRAEISFIVSAQDASMGCRLQSNKLAEQIAVAEYNLGIEKGTIYLHAPKISYETIGAWPAEHYCRFIVGTNRRDLRFSKRLFNTRYYSGNKSYKEVTNGVCMDDVYEAEKIPNSIGAKRHIESFTCDSLYLLPGLDRLEVLPNGRTKLIKFK
jgi:hypothetical protein